MISIPIRENDGVQVLGTTVLDTFDRLEDLESTAEAMINGPALNAGVIHRMPEDVIAELERAIGPGASRHTSLDRFLKFDPWRRWPDL